MIRKLSFTTLVGAVIELVEKNTGLRNYDIIPRDAELPHYHTAMTGQSPNDTKTMFKEKYEIVIHAWAMCQESSEPIYEAIENLQTALTEYIKLPAEYDLINQIPKGVQQIIQDEDGSMHAILGYEFEIAYGFKMKI